MLLQQLYFTQDNQHHHLPYCYYVCNVLNGERKILFVECNIVLNLQNTSSCWKNLRQKFLLWASRISSMKHVLWRKSVHDKKIEIETEKSHATSPIYFILNQHRQMNILWIGCNRKIEWNCCEIITSYIEFMWSCIISSWYASLIVYQTFFPVSRPAFHTLSKVSNNIDIGIWAPPIAIFESCKMSPLKFCYFNDMHVIAPNPFKEHIIVTFSHSNLVFIHFLKAYNLIRNNLANDRFRNSVHKIIFFRRQTCKYARIPFSIWTFRLTYVKRHSLNFWEFV